MSNPENSTTYWQSLAIAADQGQLFLDPEAATLCSQACDEYISKLIVRQRQAEALAEVDGWGEFDSGQALRRIYAEKAVGGENNMVDVLQGHIDVVLEMQAVFQKFFAGTESTDEGNATSISQSGGR